MWLQLSQIFKSFHRRKRKKISIIFSHDVTKIRKTRMVSRVGFHLGARSCDAMYRLIPAIYRVFCHPFLAPGLNTCLDGF